MFRFSPAMLLRRRRALLHRKRKRSPTKEEPEEREAKHFKRSVDQTPLPPRSAESRTAPPTSDPMSVDDDVNPPPLKPNPPTKTRHRRRRRRSSGSTESDGRTEKKGKRKIDMGEHHSGSDFEASNTPDDKNSASSDCRKDEVKIFDKEQPTSSSGPSPMSIDDGRKDEAKAKIFHKEQGTSDNPKPTSSSGPSPMSIDGTSDNPKPTSSGPKPMSTDLGRKDDAKAANPTAEKSSSSGPKPMLIEDLNTSPPEPHPDSTDEHSATYYQDKLLEAQNKLLEAQMEIEDLRNKCNNYENILGGGGSGTQ